MKEIACIIGQIDEETELRRPIMDDYDAGVVEGLKLAREIARHELIRNLKDISANGDNKWEDIFCETEFKEFRYK